MRTKENPKRLLASIERQPEAAKQGAADPPYRRPLERTTQGGCGERDRDVVQCEPEDGQRSQPGLYIVSHAPDSHRSPDAGLWYGHDPGALGEKPTWQCHVVVGACVQDQDDIDDTGKTRPHGRKAVHEVERFTPRVAGWVERCAGVKRERRRLVIDGKGLFAKRPETDDSIDRNAEGTLEPVQVKRCQDRIVPLDGANPQMVSSPEDERFGTPDAHGGGLSGFGKLQSPGNALPDHVERTAGIYEKESDRFMVHVGCREQHVPVALQGGDLPLDGHRGQAGLRPYRGGVVRIGCLGGPGATHFEHRHPRRSQ